MKFSCVHLGSNVKQIWGELVTQVKIHRVGHLVATTGTYTISSELLSHPMTIKSESVKNQKQYHVISDFRLQRQWKGNLSSYGV